MRLKMALGRVAYPTHEVEFNIVIQPATCDCNLLVWDQPAQLVEYTKLMASPVFSVVLQRAIVNEASKTAEPAIRSCTGSKACDMTSSIVFVDKATQSLDTAFMSFDDSSDEFVVMPTVSSQIGTYTMEMTQTVYTGHDPMVMDVIVIEVDCIIEEIRTPTPLSDVIYHLMATAQTHTLTPNFLQYPPCDYTLVENIEWTIPTGAPVTVDPADDYTITIESSNLDLHGVYELIMQNSVEYVAGGQSWTPSI